MYPLVHLFRKTEIWYLIYQQFGLFIKDHNEYEYFHTGSFRQTGKIRDIPHPFAMIMAFA